MTLRARAAQASFCEGLYGRSARFAPPGTLWAMPQLGAFEKALRVGEGRRMRRLQGQAAYIATLEPEFQALSDAELRAKTAEFRQRLENGEELGNLLFEA